MTASTGFIDVLVLQPVTIGRRQYQPGAVIRQLPLPEAARLARLSRVQLKYGTETTDVCFAGPARYFR